MPWIEYFVLVSECWWNQSLSTGFAVDTFWNTVDADVVSYEKKGKPELSADHFDGLSAHNDSVNAGETKDQIAVYRETLTDSEQADLLVDFTLEPRNALKCVIKDCKKEG